MPRTTIDLDSTVLEDLRHRSAAEGKSMGEVASELLAGPLRAHADVREQEPFRWRTQPLGRPRVDLEDRDAVWAVLDGRA